MRRIFAAAFIAAATTAVGQAGGARLAEGGLGDLAGVTKVYLSPTADPPTLEEVVETIRRREPRLSFVAAREDAEVCLRFSFEVRREEDRVPPAPGEFGGRGGRTTYTTVFVLTGEVVRLVGGEEARLIAKFERSGERKSVAGSFARRFVELYRKANPAARHAAAPRVPPTFAGGGRRPAAPAGGARAAPEERAASAEEVVRVDTTLVTIHASVTDVEGRPAGPLRREDFVVTEDGVPQDIAHFEPVESPFAVALLLDTSASVRAKLERMTRAANDFVGGLRPDDLVVAITFGREVRVLAGPAKVSEVRGRGLKVPPAGGGTRMYDALDYAFDEHVRPLPGRKAVVLLTDGVDGGSFLADAAGTLHEAEELDALIYVVRYDTYDDEAAAVSRRIPGASSALPRMRRDYERAGLYLRTLAEKTGGRVFSAAGDGDLVQSFASVAGELGRQYSLGYYPRDARREGRRRVGVEANAPNLSVRARDSYVIN